MNFSSKGVSTGTVVAVVAIIVIVAAGVFMGTRDEGMEVQNPDTLTVQTIGEADSLDPAYPYDTASSEIIFNVYETLVHFEGESTEDYKPMLAEDWEVSEDGETYSFKIRDNVYFHNGEKLTPEDVEYSLERVMVMDTPKGAAKLLLEPLVGVKSTKSGENFVVDYEDIDSSVEVENNWVHLNLAGTYPPIMDIIAHPVCSIVEKDWAVQHGAWPGTKETWENYNKPEEPPLHDVMSGTGPFEFERWDKGSLVELSRNENYWREPAELESVRFEVVEEWSTRKESFLAGDADIVDVPRANKSELLDEEGEPVEGLELYEGLKTLEINPAAFYTYELDGEGSDYLSPESEFGDDIPENFFADEHVRKGFTYAFDFETYIDDVFGGDAEKVPGPVPSAMEYFHDNLDPYEYNPEKAEEHFKKAWGGTVEDPGPVWENGFKVAIVTNEGADARVTGAQIWADGVENINEDFTVNAETLPWPNFLDAFTTRKAPIYILGWTGDYNDPNNFVVPFMSGGIFAATQGYSNSRADTLAQEGMDTIDTEERDNIYRELQEIYVEDNPSFPLAAPVSFQFTRSWVEGWYHNPLTNDQVYAYPIYKSAE